MGVKMGGLLCKSVSFAGDQTFISQSVKGLQVLVGVPSKHWKQYSMKIDCEETTVGQFCNALRPRNARLR